MNFFVADPHWGWWIIWYFFLGGIAAGAYFAAALIELSRSDEHRALSRAGYVLAFPLILVCGVLLILDLDQPSRFWHMLVRSEVVREAWSAGWPWSAEGWGLLWQAPLLKYWSPMSIGSWAISLFGACSLLSFVASIRPHGWIARTLRRPLVGGPARVIGCAVGFFVAAYTGALLTATNQPLWSDTAWIAALFLTSAASTGLAAMLLLNQWRAACGAAVPAARAGETPAPQAVSRVCLERADRFALFVELIVFVLFLISLGSLVVPIFQTSSGKLLIFGTLTVGLLLPLALHLRPKLAGRNAATFAAICVLLGGFVLRYAILCTPPEILRDKPDHPARAIFTGGFGPESGRMPDGSRGADPGNRSGSFTPRSKLFEE